MIKNIQGLVNFDKVFILIKFLKKKRRCTFAVGRMTQYMLIKACIYIAVPRQKLIVLLKIKIYREK